MILGTLGSTERSVLLSQGARRCGENPASTTAGCSERHVLLGTMHPNL